MQLEHNPGKDSYKFTIDTSQQIQVFSAAYQARINRLVEDGEEYKIHEGFEPIVAGWVKPPQVLTVISLDKLFETLDMYYEETSECVDLIAEDESLDRDQRIAATAARYMLGHEAAAASLEAQWLVFLHHSVGEAVERSSTEESQVNDPRDEHRER